MVYIFRKRLHKAIVLLIMISSHHKLHLTKKTIDLSRSYNTLRTNISKKSFNGLYHQEMVTYDHCHANMTIYSKVTSLSVYRRQATVHVPYCEVFLISNVFCHCFLLCMYILSCKDRLLWDMPGITSKFTSPEEFLQSA